MNTLRLEDFDAIAFDVEGTLADTIPTHHIARLKAFEHHGFGSVTREQHELGPTYGSSTADIIGGVLHASGHIQKDTPFKDHPVVQKVKATKSELFGKLAAQGFTEMPGASAFIREVAQKKAGHLALVTSSPEEFVLPFLDRYDLRQFFPDELIISEDTVIANNLEGKPAPDPYLLAKDRLHAKNVLVFEDTVTGVAAAKAAGATVIALSFEPNNAKLFEQGGLSYPPDYIVKDYAEARQLLGL